MRATSSSLHAAMCLSLLSASLPAVSQTASAIADANLKAESQNCDKELAHQTRELLELGISQGYIHLDQGVNSAFMLDPNPFGVNARAIAEKVSQALGYIDTKDADSAGDFTERALTLACSLRTSPLWSGLNQRNDSGRRTLIEQWSSIAEVSFHRVYLACTGSKDFERLGRATAKADVTQPGLGLRWVLPVLQRRYGEADGTPEEAKTVLTAWLEYASTKGYEFLLPIEGRSFPLKSTVIDVDYLHRYDLLGLSMGVSLDLMTLGCFSETKAMIEVVTSAHRVWREQTGKLGTWELPTSASGYYSSRKVDDIDFYLALSSHHSAAGEAQQGRALVRELYIDLSRQIRDELPDSVGSLHSLLRRIEKFHTCFATEYPGFENDLFHRIEDKLDSLIDGSNEALTTPEYRRDPEKIHTGMNFLDAALRVCDDPFVKRVKETAHLERIITALERAADLYSKVTDMTEPKHLARLEYFSALTEEYRARKNGQHSGR